MPVQHNEYGNIIAYDDQDILDNDILIRRVSTQHIVENDAGEQRISSMLYNPSGGPNGGMSVDIEKSISKAGLDPKIFVMTEGVMGAIFFRVGDLRAIGFKVGADPILNNPEYEDNPYHGEVWGTKRENGMIIGKFTRGQKKQLARMARWHIEIPNVKLQNT